jgi:hypothetical protein
MMRFREPLGRSVRTVAQAASLVLGLCATWSFGAIEFVQSRAAYSQFQLRLEFPATAGNTLIVALSSVTQGCVVSDDQSNPYVVAVGPTRGLGSLSNSYNQILYAKDINATAKALVIVMDCTEIEALVLEYSGMDPLSPFDVGLGARSSSTTSMTCGPVTTAAPNSLIIGWALSAGQVTMTAPTFRGRLFFNGDVVGELMVTTPGLYTLTSVSDSPSWIFQMAAFKPASGQVDGGVRDAGAAVNSAHFVQASAALATGGSMALALPKPTQPGNTVVVALNYAATPITGIPVSDSAGNSYRNAIGPTTGTGSLNNAVSAIYYSWGVDAGPIPLAITVNIPGSVDARVLEYQGVVPGDPLEQASAAVSSTSRLLSSGSVTTTHADQVLVGWAKSPGVVTSGPGFEARNQFMDDLLEDQVVTASGTYSATASSSQSTWIMQLVTFKFDTLRTDGGVADAGVADAGVADAGVADAGVSDAGVADAGVADAGVADAGVADAGVADAGASEAPSVDGGMLPLAGGAYQVGCSCSEAPLPSGLSPLGWCLYRWVKTRRFKPLRELRARKLSA